MRAAGMARRWQIGCKQDSAECVERVWGGRMADVINLRTARKAKARSATDSQAAANRAAFGRTKAERAADGDEAARRTALLDGAKRSGAPAKPDAGDR